MERMNAHPPPVSSQEDAVRACIEFSDYLRQLARERRVRPRDDLISRLGQVMDEGSGLTEDELVGTCVLLLNAGHEATVNSTLLGWWALFRHPDRLKELRADPGLLFCLGAPLGRLELQTSFRSLLDRFPDLELVEEPRFKPNYIIRGLEGLVVRP